MADAIVSTEAVAAFDYSVPRPCKKCGVIFSGRCCRSCKNAWRRANRKANPEQVRAATKELRDKDRDKYRAAAAEYRTRNPDAVRIAKEKYRNKGKTPEQIALAQQRGAHIKMRKTDPGWVEKTAKQKKKERARIYREQNPEKVKAQLAAWTAAHPGYNRIKVQNRRARRISNGGVLSKGLADKLLKLQRGRCACCGQMLGEDYHLDHIQPLSRGGSHSDSNIQLLHRSCNLEKHSQDPIEFMQERGFLL